jgi:hypothetical protein
VSEVVIRQTVVSGSSQSTFELLLDGESRARRTIDVDDPVGRELIQRAQAAARDAQREAVLEGYAMMRGGGYAAERFVDWRDRYRETQAMVRAFAGVVFPDVVRGWQQAAARGRES